MLARLLREPLLQFVSIGAILFLLFGLSNDDVVDDVQRIIITQTDIDRLSTLWKRNRQREPTEAELEGLINAHIREEVLYRTALEMGLDRNDTIVRRRLAQ
ncbi:MAG: peptidyl-prolyl cis-trans isomerase, partial [Gammaproteobacteria bacterium]|nr:peptidyl-prolyl cis-trans isomerase [Gammaproteobacteria bacterium]